MIQLNNVSAAMSSSVTGTPGSSTDPSSLDSFENALSEAVAQTLQKFGINPNSVNISIAPASVAGDSSTKGAAAASPKITSTGASSSSLAPFMNNPSNSSAVSTPAPRDVQPAQDPVQSFNDAYWAKQPAAVQQLRTINDQGQRTLMATQLATQGYKIDVPIMMWGWDPSQVTSLRQSYGYTWVPSALQNPVAVAPGLSEPGMQPYDPNNAPAGSIAV
jgi:hypothetical protein